MHDEDETLSVDGQIDPEVMRGHRVVVAVDGSVVPESEAR